MKLIRELLEQHRSVLSYFDHSDVENFKHLKWKSRDKMIMMPIDLFLSLAKPGRSDEKEERVANMLKSNEKFDLPYLNIDVDEQQAKVSGHEGRHRARALKLLGYNVMPVVLRTNRIRWSEQDDKSNFDYLQTWPETLVSESGSKTISFPVSRKDATKDFQE